MDDIKLIVEVEQNKLLYDPSETHYKNNLKKNSAWSRISQTLGVSVEDCQKRWRTLRERFNKERKKGTKSGSAGGSQKEWKYLQTMAFLLPHLQPRNSRSSIDCDPWEALDLSHGDVEEETEEAHDAAENTENSQTDTRPKELSPPVRKRAAPTLEDKLLAIVKEPSTQPQLNMPREGEEMYYFALSLVPTLNKLSERGRLRARSVLTEAVSNIYDQDQVLKLSTTSGSGPKQWDHQQAFQHGQDQIPPLPSTSSHVLGRQWDQQPQHQAFQFHARHTSHRSRAEEAWAPLSSESTHYAEL
ncbi:uncharacterized protein LOC134098525 [Sardina pilchardus]|uniref:uncharacterized protein LOC134098525 n=1 Tax=Sardina pilchardus TaxID=27697 RepID=UPI002E1342A7